MSINQWLSLLCAGVMVYFVPGWLPEPSGTFWFSYMSLWSVLAIYLILQISESTTAYLIAYIEFAAIIINTISYTQFVGLEGLVYTHYSSIIDVLAAMQVIIWIIGAPWSGLANVANRVVERLRLVYILRHTNNGIASQVGKLSNRETP